MGLSECLSFIFLEAIIWNLGKRSAGLITTADVGGGSKPCRSFESNKKKSRSKFYVAPWQFLIGGYLYKNELQTKYRNLSLKPDSQKVTPTVHHLPSAIIT